MHPFWFESKESSHIKYGVMKDLLRRLLHRSRQWGRWKRCALVLFIAVCSMIVLSVLILAFTAASIWLYSKRDETRSADAAIVLGAAVYSNKPSPAFEQRILHAVSLFKNGTVPVLVFTGGKAEGDYSTESEAAARMATDMGVPRERILVETSSTKTWENFTFSKPLLESKAIRKVLVVSDPMHMKRAVHMAGAVGLEAYSSPTTTTVFRSRKTKLRFLKQEVLYYLGFRLRRMIGMEDFLATPAIQSTQTAVDSSIP